MKKDATGREKRLCSAQRFRAARRTLAFLAVACVLLVPRRAAAQCEIASATQSPLQNLINQDINNINTWMKQEANPYATGNGSPGGFIDNLIQSLLGMNPGAHGLIQYYASFYTAVEQSVSDWMTQTGNLAPTLKSMTMELHASQVDQTQMLGQLMDAAAANAENTDLQRLAAEAQRRYEPSRLACTMDSTGRGLNRAYQIARAFNTSLALENEPVLENAKPLGSSSSGSVTYDPNNPYVGLPSSDFFSYDGRNQDLAYMWKQYTTEFCDPTMGDQGCTAAGPLAGKEKDIGALLWGPQQTIDPTNKQNILVMQSALRYIIDPLVSDPLTPTVAASPAGHTQLLLRHSELAYVNDIYNVLGIMLSERLGGSGIDVSPMEAEAGVPATDTAPEGAAGASYMEIMQAMTRDRFENPYYLVRMIGDKSQVMREQLTLNALRLETMNDTFNRLEDRLFLESAEYGQDLNKQIPQSSPQYSPLP